MFILILCMSWVFLEITSVIILVFFLRPSISHQVVLRPLMKELASRGHEIVVLTADPAYSNGTGPTDLNYEDEVTKHSKQKLDMDFEPITISIKSEKVTAPSNNCNCDDFSSYALNCTVDAAFIYNSSRMSPPQPTKINDWCRAIKHLTNCAIDWNTDCKDVTDSHFNEESIKGHIHVVNNICDDEWFLIQYEELADCIEESSDQWESCYLTFKDTVEEQKNSTTDWTHYEVHFQLCCARARFRRCTLDIVFSIPNQCVEEHGITLQKFSVIISEGSVYQECDRNMMYENCPDGDPRPTGAMLKRLMRHEVISSTPTLRCQIPIYFSMITLLFRTV